ncbi:tyrosine-protein kinase Etk/Wzc [Dysgonomonas sp. PH5-45]|uniref:GumC family protein n=1 Tax=unclassified Dysgonomonas TaxID=2630389 RepID=UPI0024752036|nr:MULTISPECIES: polysaccharide biosynthesis tyrosine autokinase [unclassified Dysgonomonas]MDH6354144.1 tyrosine-protein kinase Etk/Wzc [Dysgonomonas sp. PH5-45]MDH6387005.1 tyrosine-protein kinase Etk/Wzc [Dysgonomonas sp. PH5-37]
MSKQDNSQKKTSDFVSLKDIILGYTKYWKWFLISVIVCFCIAAIYYKTANKVYYMAASIMIKTESSGGAKQMMEASLMKATGIDGLASSANTEDEVSLIGSQTMVRNMINELKLNATYRLKKFPFNKSLYNSSPVIVQYEKSINDTLNGVLKMELEVDPENKNTVEIKYNKEELGTYTFDKFPTTIKTACGDFTFEKSPQTDVKDKDFTLYIAITGLDLAAEDYRKKIGISTSSKKSNIINLGIDDTDKQRGRDILDKLIELYNIDALDDKNKTAFNSAKFIKERIDSISIDLNSIETRMERYKIDNNLTDLTAEIPIFVESLSKTEENSLRQEIQLNLVEMLEKHLQKPENKYAAMPSSLGLPEAAIEAITEYNSAVFARQRLLQNSSETNPTVITYNQQLELLRNNVLSSIHQIRNEIRSSKSDFMKRESQMKSRLQKMPTQEREYVDIQRQQLIKSELYVFLLKKYEEAKLTLASNTPKAKIIDMAFNIFKPVAPKGRNVFSIALVLGLLIPVGGIYLYKLFRFKLASKEELEETTHLPVLGEICLDKSGEKAVVQEGTTNSTAELFRLLRSNIQFVLKKPEKVILITSSISGEGKSFFSLNLALSFALISKKKIVIVGLDIRNPLLTQYIGAKSKIGMTTYLASEDMKPEEIIEPLSDIHPNLYFVPAGPIPPNPAELLLRERLDEFFEYLRENYDYVFVDSAPVGMVSDTFALDRISDMTLYLYRANYTNKSNLKLAEAVVRDEKLKKMFLVMNGTSTKSAYGYGYGNKNTKGNK